METGVQRRPARPLASRPLGPPYVERAATCTGPEAGDVGEGNGKLAGPAVPQQSGLAAHLAVPAGVPILCRLAHRLVEHHIRRGDHDVVVAVPRIGGGDEQVNAVVRPGPGVIALRSIGRQAAHVRLPALQGHQQLVGGSDDAAVHRLARKVVGRHRDERAQHRRLAPQTVGQITVDVRKCRGTPADGDRLHRRSLVEPVLSLRTNGQAAQQA